MIKLLTILAITVVSVACLTGCATVVDTESVQFQDKYGNYDYCRIKAVKQKEKNSCGSACLTAVLNYWGIDITEEQILAKHPISSSRGYSLSRLRLIAIENGLEAYVVSMKDDYEESIKGHILKGRPVICAVEFPVNLHFANQLPIYGYIYRTLLWSVGPRKNHYIVVFGIYYNSFLIMDPEHGLLAISAKDFYDSWSQMDYASLVCGVK